MKLGYKQTEVGVVPDEWEVCSVRKKGEVLTGKALAVNAPGVQRPYLRTKNVFDGRIDIGDVLTMPMTDEQFTQFRIRNGDVLLNEGQSLELVGRCAIYQDEYPEPCAIQNALLRFRAHAGVSAKFASYVFRHCQKTGVFARIALQTTSVAHLGGSRFGRLRLAWPTEAEQHAIAEALSDVDGLLGELDRLIAKKRDLKQAAMQQLLTGQTRLPGFKGEWEPLNMADDSTLKARIGWQGLTTAEYLKNGEFFLVTGTDFSDGRIAWSSCCFVEADRYTQDTNIQLRPKDILLTKDGTIGKAAFVDELPGPATLNSGVFVIRPKNKAYNPQFFYYILTSQIFVQFLTKLKAGSTISHLYQKDFVSFSFLAPTTLHEQTGIAEVLSEMDAELAGLEQRREKTRALKQGMMQELLTGRTRLV